MATNFRGKIDIFGRWSLFVTLALWNGLEYRNADGQVRSALNVATLWTYLVRFGAVTLVIRLLIFVIVWKNWQNQHIWLIISEHTQLILNKFSAFIDTLVLMINLTFVLRSLKGCCYNDQIIFFFGGGTFCRLRNWLPLLFALAFKTEYSITLYLMPLHRIKIWWTSVQ